MAARRGGSQLTELGVSADFCLGGGVITDCGSAQRLPTSTRIAIDVNADFCSAGGALIVADCCSLSLISFRRRRDHNRYALSVFLARRFIVVAAAIGMDVRSLCSPLVSFIISFIRPAPLASPPAGS